MSKGLGNIMKQAQLMQQKMARLQEELGSRQVEATAGGGMVSAVVNGKQQLVRITSYNVCYTKLLRLTSLTVTVSFCRTAF